MNIITSIATLLLLLNDTLILRGCNLSAMLPRSTFTKYHLLAWRDELVGGFAKVDNRFGCEKWLQGGSAVLALL